jgi:ADP-heptose:LPS heptosyltransferase
VAASADHLTLLTGPLGEDAARLLPGVDGVLIWACPWILNPPPSVVPAEFTELAGRLAALRFDEAVILTSFHQSALPTALLLRLAGIARIVACSEDYPGSLLDLRLPVPGEAAEPERMLAIVRAAGFELPPDDDGKLAVRLPADGKLAVRLPVENPESPYLVVHPGTSAEARAYPASHWAEAVRLLSEAGWPVAVTGSASERELTAGIVAQAQGAAQAPDEARARISDLGGALNLAELARLLSGAAAVLVANTGPAHLAAAVGTPVVSLFSPVVPAIRWAPYGVPVELLGDQSAACRGTRRTACPVPGHPCLSGVEPAEVVSAVGRLVGHQPLSPVNQLAVTG